MKLIESTNGFIHSCNFSDISSVNGSNFSRENAGIKYN